MQTLFFVGKMFRMEVTILEHCAFRMTSIQIAKKSTLEFLNMKAIVMTTPQPEYQHNLKNHLGNVRVTFSTNDYVDEAIATLETVNESQESGEFLNYAEAIKVSSNLLDHTNDLPIDPRPSEPTGLRSKNNSSIF